MESNSRIPGKIKQIHQIVNSKTIEENYNTKGLGELHTLEDKFDQLIRKKQRVFNSKHKRIGLRNENLK